MKQFKVYYRKGGQNLSTIVTGCDTGYEASEYVRDEYGPCTVTGVEEL